MKRLLMTAAAGVMLAATGMAQAQDGQALAKDQGCLKCHAMSSKKTGPSIKSIAAEFKKSGVKGDKAVAQMKEKHEADDLKGVKGDAELKAAVEYFLSN